MVERRHIKNFDFTLAFAAAAIVAFGCVAIYSASSGGGKEAAYVERQLVFGLLGLAAAAILASIDHSVYHRHAGKLYGWTLIVLLAVLRFGHESKGAQRWIAMGPFQFQPSEFAKIALVIALAVFFVKRHEEIRGLKTFALSFVYLAIPMALIFRQPDLGTSLALLAIWVTIAFVAGTDVKNILLFVGAAAALGCAGWNGPGLMKDDQTARVISFSNPAADPLGSGYHVAQSRIAIGSGQILGKGYLRGTQRELRFIPEQHTDFIFTVVGEETGFVGGAGLVALYFILLWRALNIMAASEDMTGRVIAAGVVGMLLFHVFVNIGMTVGIMPVTGVPLPLFSYGGSSLMSNLMAIGLLEGISMRRHRISF